MSFKRIFSNQTNSIEISIDLESHTGTVIDFENMFSELEIIEDVTNFVITGSIIFADKNRFGYKYEEQEPQKRVVWECPRCGRTYGSKEAASNCRR